MIFYGDWKGKRQRPHPLSLLTAFAASSPKGTPLGYAGKFAAVSKAVPLGKVASPQAMTEGVSPSRLPPQVKIASGGKKDYTIKNVCGAQAAGAEEMKHETTGLL